MSEIQTVGGRQSGRVRLVVPCEIKGSKETLKVPMGDISLDGCRLLSSQEHEVGEKLNLTLRLSARVEITAEVRWTKSDGSSSRQILGCKFAHSAESRKILKETLQGMASAIDTAARRVK